jgi:hypothetical protein
LIALPSSTVGIAMAGRLDGLDMMFHLATIGAAQADDPSRLAAINKGHVVEDAGFRCLRDHARLALYDPFIHPHQRGFSIEFGRHSQRNAMLVLVRQVLGRIELEVHGFNVAALNLPVKI